MQIPIQQILSETRQIPPQCHAIDDFTLKISFDPSFYAYFAIVAHSMTSMGVKSWKISPKLFFHVHL